MAVRSHNEGGWIPVINKKRNRIGDFSINNQPLFTLFIDNFPEEADHGWLRKTFNNYGVVKDSFIPHKRSKRTGSKFGFVRYDCHISAGVAISKSNGLWVRDKKLFVKEASFGQFMNRSDLKIPIFQRSDVGTNLEGTHVNQDSHFDMGKSGQKSFNRGISFAQMVSGETNKGGSTGKGTEKGMESSDQVCRKVSLKSVGNGWLYRSAVAKLHKLISINDLMVQMARMGLDNIDIKALGGRSVILTCTSREEMEKMIEEECLQRWFSEVKPWDGQAACVKRFVWLCCYGIPLNGWSNTSFKSIGELWGSFISTDESTLKMSSFAEAKILIATNIFKEIDEWIIVEVEGKSYKVKVMEDPCDQPHEVEEQIPKVILHSNSEDESSEEEKNEEHEVDVPVSESDTNGSSSDAEPIVRQGSGIHCDLASDGADIFDGANQLVASTKPDDSEIHAKDSTKALADVGANTLDGENLVVADSELSEPILDNGDGDIIVDDTAQTLDDGGVAEFENLSEVGFITNEDAVNSLDGIQICVDLNADAEGKEVKNSEKGKWKQKSIEQILGIPKTNKKGGKKKQSCVLLRSAVAAAALPISSEGINRTHLDEAQAIWEVNKIMGLSYMGDEEDVIRRIAIMEAKDEEWAKGHASHPLIGS